MLSSSMQATPNLLNLAVLIYRLLLACELFDWNVSGPRPVSLFYLVRYAESEFRMVSFVSQWPFCWSLRFLVLSLPKQSYLLSTFTTLTLESCRQCSRIGPNDLHSFDISKPNLTFKDYWKPWAHPIPPLVSIILLFWVCFDLYNLFI